MMEGSPDLRVHISQKQVPTVPVLDRCRARTESCYSFPGAPLLLAIGCAAGLDSHLLCDIIWLAKQCDITVPSGASFTGDGGTAAF